MKRFQVNYINGNPSSFVSAEGHRKEKENYVFFDTADKPKLVCPVSEVQSIQELAGHDGRTSYVPPRPGSYRRY